MNQVTSRSLREMKAKGEKFTSLTVYDYSFAALVDSAGIDVALVGDSLGMVIQGHQSTLPVTLDEMIYHTSCVANGVDRALLIADLPFGAYQVSPEEAYESSVELIKFGGAHMVKLEGGGAMVEVVDFLSERGIPVCAHLGLTPQYVHQLGGYRVQGREEETAKQLIEGAHALEKAGAGLLVLEAIPSGLAAQITSGLSIPTLGIGAGGETDGQVLVLHDLLGIYPDNTPRFAKNFMTGADSVEGAIKAYIKAVKSGLFPAPEHSFD